MAEGMSYYSSELGSLAEDLLSGAAWSREQGGEEHGGQAPCGPPTSTSLCSLSSSCLTLGFYQGGIPQPLTPSQASGYTFL